MNQIKHTMLTLVFLVFALVSFSQSSLLTLRVYEGDSDKNSKILVVSETTVLETVELFNTLNTKYWDRNQALITSTLNKYYSKGYSISDPTSITFVTVNITTYILRKE